MPSPVGGDGFRDHRPRVLGSVVGVANHVFAEATNADLAPTNFGGFAERTPFTALRQKLSAPGELSFGVDDVPVGPLHSHPDQDSFGIDLYIRNGHKPSIPDLAMEADCPASNLAGVGRWLGQNRPPPMTAPPGIDALRPFGEVQGFGVRYAEKT